MVLARRGDRRGSVALLVLITALLLLVTCEARADVGFTSFSARAIASDGSDELQAGAHPFAATVEFQTTETTHPVFGTRVPVENLKDLTVDLPPGFVGDPSAAPTCGTDDLAGGYLGSPPTCPVASQVGIVEILFARGDTEPVAQAYPVYNMQPERGQLARFGFNPLAGVPIEMVIGVRTDGDYGVTATLTNISEGQAFVWSKVTLWGVPAAPVHDVQRGAQWTCFGDLDPANCVGGGASAGIAEAALLTNPARCGARDVSRLRGDSWLHPLDVVEIAYTAASPLEHCERQQFTPALSVTPGTSTPDAPAGLDVDLAFPYSAVPHGLAAPPLKDARVTLPAGMTINPGSAAGLQACTDQQLQLRSTAAVTCPDASKIGTAQATTPVLPDQLTGSVYLRPQASDDPASGEMFRIALVLENRDRGLSVRLPGQISASPTTGQLTATFDDNPQLPVSDIKLSFKSGPRAPLVTPASCGPKTIDAELTSWGGQTAQPPAGFGVDCTAGLGGFAPSLTAGAAQPIGGAFSPFALSMSKPDGNADVDGLSLVLPTGLLASLKGNLGTQVGTVKAFAGPGSNPFMLPGQVFLEGAYGDAPFSLRVVVPAKAGPFDLGDVVVRQKIYVDPIDAHVTVVSDLLPTIVKGVPVRLQRLDVNVDKAGFMVNPTSCAAKAIGGTLGAVDGQSAPINVRFQVGDCASLGLKPSLALSLSGKGQTTDGKHPAVTANLAQPVGQANLKKVRVALPLSLALDPDNANGLCEFVDGSKTEPTCPKASIVGTATATTPILDQPLTGPVYFVKNIRKDPKSGREIRTLPKLVIPLVGQNGVKLMLTGTSDVVDDQLVTTFDNIPDAPVSSFKLNVIGGKGGILTVSGADICKATQIADQQIDGQNIKNADADVYIQTPSCPLKILSKTVGKTSVTVKVGGLGAGKVTVTGKGIKKTSKTISKSTVATITAKSSMGTPSKLTVSFDPTGPAKAHAVVTSIERKR
jgi:hypothetical protein